MKYETTTQNTQSNEIGMIVHQIKNTETGITTNVIIARFVYMVHLSVEHKILPSIEGYENLNKAIEVAATKV